MLRASTGVAAAAVTTSAALPRERTFDAERAHLFYKLAASSYCAAPDVLAWDCPPCRATNLSAAVAPRVFSDAFTGASGFVGAFGAGGHTLVLSFRGSENLQNWVENLKIAKTDRNMSCAGCKVHSGFYDCWRSLSRPMVAELRALRASHPLAAVYVTGHSLGAAIAMLAAYELEFEQHIPVAGVYTYGQPRVGNHAFRSFYNAGAPRRTWRLTHWRDPVPHLPLRSMGFVHIGTEVWWDEGWHSGRVCDGSGEDTSCADSVGYIGLDFSIYDHLHYFNEIIGDGGCFPGPSTTLRGAPGGADVARQTGRQIDTVESAAA